MEQITVLLHADHKQGLHAFQIIRAQLLVTVEMVNWMQERIAMEQITVLTHVKLKQGTHVPITFVLTVEIVFYKQDKSVTMGISQAVHNVKLSLPTNAKVFCRLPHCVTFVETPYMSSVKNAITETNLVA